MAAELVLIRGLPGSGKTTAALKLVSSAGFEHFEADHYLETREGYTYARWRVEKAHGQCILAVERALERGAKCVVSNTFCTLAELWPYIDMAKRLNVPVHYVEARGKWQNIHGVPQERIDAMKVRWESLPIELDVWVINTDLK